jgi:DNA-binding NarL/FixJ family response regulator
LLEQHRDLDVVGEGWHGGQAIQRCRDEQPDLLVIDLDMPVMDGYSALGRVRELSPRTQILVLTGLSDDDTVARAHAAGADHVFSKSVEPAAIVAAIREMSRSPISR